MNADARIFATLSPAQRWLRHGGGALLLGLGWAAGAAAADPNWLEAVPLANPQEMLQRLFGPASDEDEQALAQIRVSPQDERRYGQMVVDSFLAELKRRNIRVASQGKDVEYLRALIATVRPQLQHPDRFRKVAIYLAQSPECEARAVAGGTLIFFQGLLERAGSEAALIGVVGHELSHLDREHLLKRTRQLKLAEQRLSTQGKQFSFEKMVTAGTTFTRLWTRPFRPEDEAQADEDGATWAYQLGYDPRAMAELYSRLHQRRPLAKDFLPSFLQTHPAFDTRAQTLQDLYTKLQQEQPQERLYLGTENLRRRIPRSAQRLER